MNFCKKIVYKKQGQKGFVTEPAVKHALGHTKGIISVGQIIPEALMNIYKVGAKILIFPKQK